MDNLKEKHQLIFEKFTFEYFQNCDHEQRFPIEYFDELKSENILYHLVMDYKSALLFSEIACLIGEYSISASLCWVMHNQQSNIIMQLKPDLYKDISERQLLIASVTSEYGNETSNSLKKEVNSYRVIRESPICSYRAYADVFLATMNFNEDLKSEKYFVLLPNKDVSFVNDNNLSVTKSTCSGPVKFNVDINEQQVIGKLSKVFSTIFVPLAHIGWMSSYNGGLQGVLSRIRRLARSRHNDLKVKITKELFINRIAKAISLEHVNKCIIVKTLEHCFTLSGVSRGMSLNILKTEVSNNIRAAAYLLDEALGPRYTISPLDKLGADIFCRDSRAATLMVNNDAFYSDIFDLWLLNIR